MMKSLYPLYSEKKIDEPIKEKEHCHYYLMEGQNLKAFLTYKKNRFEN